MIKITITANDTPIELTIPEAKRIYQELGEIFKDAPKPLPMFPGLGNPHSPYIGNPWCSPYNNTGDMPFKEYNPGMQKGL